MRRLLDEFSVKFDDSGYSLAQWVLGHCDCRTRSWIRRGDSLCSLFRSDESMPSTPPFQCFPVGQTAPVTPRVEISKFAKPVSSFSVPVPHPMANRVKIRKACSESEPDSKRLRFGCWQTSSLDVVSQCFIRFGVLQTCDNVQILWKLWRMRRCSSHSQ